MPRVIMRLWPGKSEQQKTQLAEEIVKDVMIHPISSTEMKSCTGSRNTRCEERMNPSSNNGTR